MNNCGRRKEDRITTSEKKAIHRLYHQEDVSVTYLKQRYGRTDTCIRSILKEMDNNAATEIDTTSIK